jgi:hypothetical protein
MDMEDQYLKASRYDIKASRHNFQVFHCRLKKRPWLALFFSILMGILAANGFFNLVNAPRWDLHPWMGSSLGAIALIPGVYFLATAVDSLCQRYKGKGER